MHAIIGDEMMVRGEDGDGAVGMDGKTEKIDVMVLPLFTEEVVDGMVILSDGGALREIVAAMAVLVEDTIAGAMILGADTPYFCTCFEVMPYFRGHIVLPTEEINTVTLTDTVQWAINESIVIG